MIDNMVQNVFGEKPRVLLTVYGENLYFLEFLLIDSKSYPYEKLPVGDTSIFLKLTILH